MNQNDPPTEHILACLSSSPSNAKIVRTAATMAKAFGGSFTALYVKTPDADWMSAQDKQRLQQHIHMAEQAGADITTLYGDDIPQQIAEFARISGITKIVLGRSSVHRRSFWAETLPMRKSCFLRVRRRSAAATVRSCSTVRFRNIVLPIFPATAPT